MRETLVPPSNRTLQFFVGNDYAVSEVSIKVGSTDDLHCDCRGFAARSTCKHVALVRNRMRLNHGGYPVDCVPAGLSQEELTELAQDNARFRMFVMKYARVEVL